MGLVREPGARRDRLGAVDAPAGLVDTFLIAGGVMVAGAATIPFWPLFDTRKMGRDTTVYWPEPRLVVPPRPGDGPVVVSTVYTVDPSREGAFVEAMSRVRLSRLRTGATQWGLFRQSESEGVFVELFVVPSWHEHERQHNERQTETDRAYQEHAAAFSKTSPVTTHLLAATGPER